MDNQTRRDALEILDTARDNLRRIGAGGLADEASRTCSQCERVGRTQCVGCPMQAMQTAALSGEAAETTDRGDALWDVWERLGGVHKALGRVIAKADTEGDADAARRLCLIGSIIGDAEEPLECELLLRAGIAPAAADEARERQIMRLLATDGGPLRRPLGWEN